MSDYIPVIYEGVIAYPSPKPHADLANLCWQKSPQAFLSHMEPLWSHNGLLAALRRC